MKCPKCGSKILNNCCLRCGYMTNGKSVNTKYGEDKLINKKLYNEKFDVMNRNQNSIFPFIFGGLYMAYHGHIFVGLLIEIIETCLVETLGILIHCFIFLYLFRGAIYILLILISRSITAAISNDICLKLDEKKIEKIIDKYPKNYREKLYNHHTYGMICVLINMILYIFLYIAIFTSTLN